MAVDGAVQLSRNLIDPNLPLREALKFVDFGCGPFPPWLAQYDIVARLVKCAALKRRYWPK
jgi:hypothetical protein